jgi:hypothetical protein
MYHKTRFHSMVFPIFLWLAKIPYCATFVSFPLFIIFSNSFKSFWIKIYIVAPFEFFRFYFLIFLCFSISIFSSLSVNSKHLCPISLTFFF